MDADTGALLAGALVFGPAGTFTTGADGTYAFDDLVISWDMTFKKTDDPVSAGLYEVDRSLRNAVRRLDRLRSRI